MVPNNLKIEVITDKKTNDFMLSTTKPITKYPLINFRILTINYLIHVIAFTYVACNKKWI